MRIKMLEFFQKSYPKVVKLLRETTHHYDEQNLNPYHLEGDCWAHTMMVLNRAPNTNIGAAAALLHDIGKVFTREVDEEKKKVSFKGHEGMSFYHSMPIVKSFVKEGLLSTEEGLTVLKIIALHGSLYIDKLDIVGDKFSGDPDLFEMLKGQVKADVSGRFSSISGHCDNVELFDNIVIKDFNRLLTTNTLTILVGPPCCGKSTLVDTLENNVIISRDIALMEYGVLNDKGTLYSEIWKNLSEEDHKIVDGIVSKRFSEAIKQNKDVVVDMTNMSKKARRKWLSTVPKHYAKHAVVFLTEPEELYRRNELRKVTGKDIPKFVFHNMMRGLSLPMYDEFDVVYFR